MRDTEVMILRHFTDQNQDKTTSLKLMIFHDQFKLITIHLKDIFLSSLKTQAILSSEKSI